MEFNFEDIDEEEDIIVPDSLLGELIYIKFALIRILNNPQKTPYFLKLLRRQIHFFIQWKKNK